MSEETEMRPLVQQIVREAHRWAGSQDALLAAIAPFLGGVVPRGPSVTRWERGEDRPTGETLLAIAKVAGISLDEILYGKSLREEMAKLADRVRQLEGRESS